MPLSTGVISAIQFYVTGLHSYGDNALSINFYVFDSDGTTLLAAPQWTSTDGTTGLKTIPLNILEIENKPYWIAMEILRGVDNMPDGALDIEVLGRYQDLQDYQTGLVLWKSLEYTESNNPNIESSGLTNIPARVGESRFTPWVRLV